VSNWRLYNPDEIFEHFLISKRSVNALATAGEDLGDRRAAALGSIALR
jgi:hypothetical protein